MSGVNHMIIKRMSIMNIVHVGVYVLILSLDHICTNGQLY